MKDLNADTQRGLWGPGNQRYRHQDTVVKSSLFPLEKSLDWTRPPEADALTSRAVQMMCASPIPLLSLHTSWRLRRNLTPAGGVQVSQDEDCSCPTPPLSAIEKANV